MNASDPQEANQRKTIAVVGGGMTGIAAAMKLAESGLFDVTLFEKEERLGGLSTYYSWEDVTWDRFYHVILSTDSVLLDFIRKLGLVNQLFWRETRTGFYGKGQLVSMSSTMDFIRFPFMSPWQKFRMVLGILYSSQIRNPSKLDRIYVREWLTRIFGRRVYENIWTPLLRSKLGNHSEKTSAAYIWATINRLYGARGSGGSKKEKMGHVEGGYQAILSAAEKKSLDLNVLIRKSSPIDSIKLIKSKSDNSHDNCSFSLRINSDANPFIFDQVLLTVDCPEVLNIVRHIANDNDRYWRYLKSIEYLGLICFFLVLKQSLSPYYVINLLEKNLPFTGIIEATNVIPPERIEGKYLIYLPKYVNKDNLMINYSDNKIFRLFINSLKNVFSGFTEDAIVHWKVFRVDCVQPIQKLNFMQNPIGIKTPIGGLYLANTSMISNSTLNNNSAIKLALKAVNLIKNI